jgi:hypothetical protein
MAKTVGSVTINPDGSASGSGLALTIYDAIITSSTYVDALPEGAAGVPSKTQIADLANVLAATLLPMIWFDLTSEKTSAYSAQFGEIVLCDCSSAGFTVTLPNITSVDLGKWVIVKKSVLSANVLVIDGNGSDTIDGSASQNMAGQSAANMFVAITTTRWMMMSWT